MEMFGIRDLRERSGDLTRTAESGQLAVLTKRDRPFMLGVPFDEKLLRAGVGNSLAIHLYSQGVLSLSKAARLSEYCLEEFIQKLGHLGLDTVDYDPDELDEELNRFG